ncbi:MAG: hypothetical protein KY437_10065 [Actinobacteria bacterium]|nr:hypothetical protein [Actinomycetota bacterium]
MTVDLDDIIFRTRALAQTHPFSPRAYRYMNRIVARERTDQPAPEIGIWAGHALTAGYCLRRVEESETAGEVAAGAGALLPDDLDEAATHIAAAIRTDGADPYLLYPEERVVTALDRLIAGEVERRLAHWAGTVDESTWTELEEYLAWWTVKGYALRVADQLLPLEDGAQRAP